MRIDYYFDGYYNWACIHDGNGKYRHHFLGTKNVEAIKSRLYNYLLTGRFIND